MPPPICRNLFAALPDASGEEQTSTVLTRGATRIERIVSRGQTSAPDFWYEQAEGEWIVLLSGAARLAFEDGEVMLAPGDQLTIPAGLRHRVSWTAPDRETVWLAVFYPASGAG